MNYNCCFHFEFTDCVSVFFYFFFTAKWLHDDFRLHSAQAAGSQTGRLFKKVCCTTWCPPSVSLLPSVQPAKECSATGTGNIQHMHYSAEFKAQLLILPVELSLLGD